jgi:alginate O-acetyltransferase complex protein AlgI
LTFNSLQYLLFLPIVLAVYWALRGRVRQVWLLLASYIFYAAFDWRFGFLLLFTTIVDYNVGKGIENLGGDADQKRRRRLLLISITVNLTVLGFFKYFNFFVEQGVTLFAKAGFNTASPALRVLLPFGISFYTFQSIGYTVDVYRRKLPACRDAIDFATFVAYFPQLVAGPISRAKNLLPQIQAHRARPSGQQVLSGLLLIVTGLFKKVVLADPLAPVVNNAFGGTPNAGTQMVAVGVLAFAIQIYADFSGYSDMARGSSRLLNIELVHNFDQPYLSRNITEFWRRWHISLSTWLRDYLYIPLGGNRGTAARVYRNLMITMLLGGLWHGAGWNFVVWGGLHGAYLCVDRLRGARRDLSDGAPALADVPAIAATFVLVCFAWIFFRARTFADAVMVLHGFANLDGVAPEPGHVVLVLLAVVAAFTIDVVQRKVEHPLRVVWKRPALTGALVGMALVCVIIFSGGTSVPFIYFQF